MEEWNISLKKDFISGSAGGPDSARHDDDGHF
jgi:hypothetical protein